MKKYLVDLSSLPDNEERAKMIRLLRHASYLPEQLIPYSSPRFMFYWDREDDIESVTGIPSSLIREL